MAQRSLVFLVLSILFFNGKSIAQKGYYWVNFTDKDTALYSIAQPTSFLSERAIAKRTQHNIPITAIDLPVNPRYLDSIAPFCNRIHNRSKWFNAVTVLMEKDSLAKLKQFPFIDSVRYVGKYYSKPPFYIERAYEDSLQIEPLEDKPFGHGTPQLEMLNCGALHEKGFRGKGKIIAVTDGGFRNMDIIPFFDSLRYNKKILWTWDFVDADSNAYDASIHGMQVSSLMGANSPGIFMGSAPDASYVLFKTEDIRGEYRIEECNWIAALEAADSMGVDVLNSSLGYSTFSDTSMNYAYEDLDGKTSISSKGASYAFDRGMIIVTSAGNEGHTKWRFIDAPSDGPKVLAVGATDKNRKRAYFSSYGPSADGRIKPEVAAMGQMVIVPDSDAYQLTMNNGTSFSAPIISGLLASLWQAFPMASNQEILEAVFESSNQFENPDSKLGYGIPDFLRAFELLSVSK